MEQTPTPTEIDQILDETRVIALVGYSGKPERPSHRVARYLKKRGYRVIPVNPGLAGQDFFGEPVVASLADIPADAKVDMLDVFRRSEAVVPVVEAALEALPDLRTIWLQLGVTSDEARALAAEKGLNFVQDRCPHIELERRG
ncbi:CoA-binding protein [Maritimibacter fusiformis]|uniref:CoA-binding protein n=1 Tax=Maritimibacter fusiformis TaxID=2603819 RepID=A0A5D0RPN4_9RHOB|nr:CoA-binding protein [Maritimibacter fusiformis]TYB82956.1 CoA-binding protein [Maritimibacter fusiformis]